MRNLFYFLFLILLPVFLIAHPPSDINISYDINASKIYIEILHKVKSNKEHFIYEMKLYVNDKKAISQDAITQVSNEKQQVMYLIPGLKEGGKISFWAECNKGGERKKEITIVKGKGINNGSHRCCIQ